MSLASWLRGDVAVRSLSSARQRCLPAYDLVDALPNGPTRRAAWAAYAHVVYADKLLDAGEDGYVDRSTGRLAAGALAAGAASLEPGAAVPQALPRWGPGPRTERQLQGMLETLVALQTYLAYETRDRRDDVTGATLDAIDACRSKVARLWVPRPTAELRGGIADALLSGLDEAYALGLGVLAG